MWGAALKPMRTLAVWVKELVSNIERFCIILEHTCFPPSSCCFQSRSVFLLCLPSVWSSRRTVKQWNQQKVFQKSAGFRLGGWIKKQCKRQFLSHSAQALALEALASGEIPSSGGKTIKWTQDLEEARGRLLPCGLVMSWYTWALGDSSACNWVNNQISSTKEHNLMFP